MDGIVESKTWHRTWWPVLVAGMNAVLRWRTLEVEGRVETYGIPLA